MRVPKPVGYRGGDLITFGIIWLAVALSIVSDPMRVPDLIHTQLPLWFRLSLWGGTGAFAVIASVRAPWHRWAFGLLHIAPAERMLSYFWAVVVEAGPPRLSGVIVWAAVLFLLSRLTGRPEPITPPLPPPLNKPKG